MTKKYTDENTDLNIQITDSIEGLLNLETYCIIVDTIGSKKDYVTDPLFQRKIIGFYKVRRNKNWCKVYFNLLEEQRKTNTTVDSFKEILDAFEKKGFTNVEVSFASKLISSINPDLPIWDRYVIKNLGFEDEWKRAIGSERAHRIKIAVDIYKRINEIYIKYMNSEVGKRMIKEFDSLIPNYRKRITACKKIDFLLWSKK